MGSDHEAEIRASVGAHQDLGPGYDDAVAEGLVERIGAEIDKRIEARLGRHGAQAGPGAPASPGSAASPATLASPAVPASPSTLASPALPEATGSLASPGPAGSAESGAPQGYPPPSGYPPAGYPGPSAYPGYPWYPGYSWYPGYQGPVAPPGYQAPPPAPQPAGQRSAAATVATTIIALGSITLGVAATAIVAHAQIGGQAAMVLLIWAAIAIVNIAYARRG